MPGGAGSPLEERNQPDTLTTLSVGSSQKPHLVNEPTTGGATPLHVCGMSRRGQMATDTLIKLGGDLNPRDTCGGCALWRSYIPLPPTACEPACEHCITCLTTEPHHGGGFVSGTLLLEGWRRTTLRLAQRHCSKPARGGTSRTTQARLLIMRASPPLDAVPWAAASSALADKIGVRPAACRR